MLDLCMERRKVPEWTNDDVIEVGGVDDRESVESTSEQTEELRSIFVWSTNIDLGWLAPNCVLTNESGVDVRGGVDRTAEPALSWAETVALSRFGVWDETTAKISLLFVARFVDFAML